MDSKLGVFRVLSFLVLFAFTRFVFAEPGPAPFVENAAPVSDIFNSWFVRGPLLLIGIVWILLAFARQNPLYMVSGVFAIVAATFIPTVLDGMSTSSDLTENGQESFWEVFFSTGGLVAVLFTIVFVSILISESGRSYFRQIRPSQRGLRSGPSAPQLLDNLVELSNASDNADAVNHPKDGQAVEVTRTDIKRKIIID